MLLITGIIGLSIETFAIFSGLYQLFMAYTHVDDCVISDNFNFVAALSTVIATDCIITTVCVVLFVRRLIQLLQLSIKMDSNWVRNSLNNQHLININVHVGNRNRNRNRKQHNKYINTSYGINIGKKHTNINSKYNTNGGYNFNINDRENENDDIDISDGGGPSGPQTPRNGGTPRTGTPRTGTPRAGTPRSTTPKGSIINTNTPQLMWSQPQGGSVGDGGTSGVSGGSGGSGASQNSIFRQSVYSSNLTINTNVSNSNVNLNMNNNIKSKSSISDIINISDATIPSAPTMLMHKSSSRLWHHKQQVKSLQVSIEEEDDDDNNINNEDGSGVYEKSASIRSRSKSKSKSSKNNKNKREKSRKLVELVTKLTVLIIMSQIVAWIVAFCFVPILPFASFVFGCWIDALCVVYCFKFNTQNYKRWCKLCDWITFHCCVWILISRKEYKRHMDKQLELQLQKYTTTMAMTQYSQQQSQQSQEKNNINSNLNITAEKVGANTPISPLSPATIETDPDENNLDDNYNQEQEQEIEIKNEDIDVIDMIEVHETNETNQVNETRNTRNESVDLNELGDINSYSIDTNWMKKHKSVPIVTKKSINNINNIESEEEQDKVSKLRENEIQTGNKGNVKRYMSNEV